MVFSLVLYATLVREIWFLTGLDPATLPCVLAAGLVVDTLLYRSLHRLDPASFLGEIYRVDLRAHMQEGLKTLVAMVVCLRARLAGLEIELGWLDVAEALLWRLHALS